MPERPWQRLGGLLITLSTFGGAISHWLIVLIMARSAGVREVGQYSSLLAVATPVFVAGSLALRDVYMSVSEATPWKVFVVLRILGMAVSVAILSVILKLIEWPFTLFLAVLFLKLVQGAHDLSNARILRGRRLFVAGALGLADAALTVAVVAVVGAWATEASWLVLASALVGAICLVPGIWIASRTPAIEPTVGPAPMRSHCKRLLGQSSPAMIAQLLSTILMSVPIYVLSVIGTPSDVGRYSVAAYVVTFGHLFGASMTTIELPKLRELRTRSGDHVMLEEARKVGLGIAILGLAGTLAATFAGDFVLGALFGPQFEVGWLVFLFLGLCATVAAVGYMGNAASLTLNQYASQPGVMLASIVLAILSGTLLAKASLDPIFAATLAGLVGTTGRAAGLWVLSTRGAKS